MLPRWRQAFTDPPAGIAAFPLLLGLFFLTPLFIFPWAQNAYVLAKEAFVGAGISLLVIGCAAGWLRGERWRIPLEPLNALLVALPAWMAASVLWADAPILAWEETRRTLALVAGVLLVQHLVHDNRARLLLLVYTIAASSLAVAIWTLVRDATHAFGDGGSVRAVLGDWRDAISQAALGNSGHVGDFLAVGTLAWLGIFLAARGRLPWMVATIALWLHAAALIVAWSVHSNLSLIVGAGVFLWLMGDHRGDWLGRRRWRPLAVLLGGWLLIIAFYVVDHPVNPHGSAAWAPRVEAVYTQMGIEPPGDFSGGIFAQAFASPRWQSGLDTRLAIWLTTLDMIRARPWLGGGAGNFTYLYPATHSELLALNPGLARYGGSWTNAAHNEVLEFWSELGVVGLFLLIALVAAPLLQVHRRLSEGVSPGTALVLALAGGAISAVVVQAMFSFPLQLPWSSLLFFTLLAVPGMLPPRGSGERTFDVPVTREAGPLDLEVVMRNMAFPTRLSIGWRGRPLAIMATALMIAGGVYTAHRSLVPLRADVAFRDVYEGRRQLVAMGSTDIPERLLSRAREVLSIWPGHVDCRSALQGLLLEAGRHEEVLEQTPLVLGKLNAPEVYTRRIEALEALGRPAEAIDDINELLRRRGQPPLQPPANNATGPSPQ